MPTLCDSVADYVMRCVVAVTFALHLTYSGMVFLKWMAQDLPLFHSKKWNIFKRSERISLYIWCCVIHVVKDFKSDTWY